MTTSRQPLGAAPAFDVIVCGGTLGVFLAASLQLRGLQVAVVERGPLRGREQEWNLSRKELYELVRIHCRQPGCKFTRCASWPRGAMLMSTKATRRLNVGTGGRKASFELCFLRLLRRAVVGLSMLRAGLSPLANNCWVIEHQVKL